MDLNKKFSELFDDSPRTLGGNPIEASEKYRKKLEMKTGIDVQPKFDMESEIEKREENRKKSENLLAEIKTGNIGIKNSILSSFEVEQKEESFFDKLCTNIVKIEEKTGWSHKDAMRKKGFWGGVWFKVSDRLNIHKETLEDIELKRVYGKLLTLRDGLDGSLSGTDNEVRKEVVDIMSFELKCADMSGMQSFNDLNNKIMTGAGSFDKLDKFIEYHTDEEVVA